jgi:DNA-binding NtrC family response regulator
MNLAVLFVSPCPQDAFSLARMLESESLSLVHALTVSEAATKLETGTFQVVLTEANLEDGSWLDLLQMTESSNPVLIVTYPWADARFWAEAINRGAYDVLAQPFNGSEVRRVLATACGRKPLLQTGAAA